MYPLKMRTFAKFETKCATSFPLYYTPFPGS
nr:MAG TPA: hypothetical protein [Caudoviricetes sp.]